MEKDVQPSGTDGAIKTATRGCLWAAVACLVLLIAGVGGYTYFSAQAEKEALEEQKEVAEKTFSPAMEKLDEGIEQAKRKSDEATSGQSGYDIDKTVRVIHQIDAALDNQEDLGEYLAFMARQDYRDVAPDVLEARKKVFDILMQLYATQTKIENQEATYSATRVLLSSVSLVSADLSVAGGVAPSGSVGFDKKQAEELLEELKQEHDEHTQLLNELTRLENELLAVMFEYGETYYDHIEEWDRLCVLRDRAYLAVAEGNWEAVLESANKAMEAAPAETEAHLLKALALVESSEYEDQHIEKAQTLLSDYIDEHPGRSAPALLLLGVAHRKQGNTKEATLSFQQAAAYYPKQSKKLTEMLDPYEVRSFLRKSKEGNAIVDMYKTTMLGAGYFSPDLQLAKMHFEHGEVDKGQQKVLDHFSRRRNQEQWELMLSDVEFCNEFLGAHFDRILPERSHLSLEVEPTMVGSKLDIGVANDSSRDLHNATLLLALQFTDMHRHDFEILKVNETVPKVTANQITDFGTTEVDYDFLGTAKNVDDIVVHRAILLADEAVVWVDTEEHKLALARQWQERTAQDPKLEKRQHTWFEQMKTSPQKMARQVEKASNMQVEESLGADDLTITLPRVLALLNPVFRLEASGNDLSPESNSLDAESIELVFADVDNFDSSDSSPQDVSLQVHSRFGEFEIEWTKKGEVAGVDYRFQ